MLKNDALLCRVCIHMIQFIPLFNAVTWPLGILRALDYPCDLPDARASIGAFSKVSIRRLSLPVHPLALLSNLARSAPPQTQPTHLCLCFGFFEQIIYTYRPFFLRTLLHPSHSFLTELRTFMPRVCCCTNAPVTDCAEICNPILRPLNGATKLDVCVCDRSDGRTEHVWIERTGRAKRVRLKGMSIERASILAIECGGVDEAASGMLGLLRGDLDGSMRMGAWKMLLSQGAGFTIVTKVLQ